MLYSDPRPKLGRKKNIGTPYSRTTSDEPMSLVMGNSSRHSHTALLGLSDSEQQPH